MPVEDEDEDEGHSDGSFVRFLFMAVDLFRSRDKGVGKTPEILCCCRSTWIDPFPLHYVLWLNHSELWLAEQLPPFTSTSTSVLSISRHQTTNHSSSAGKAMKKRGHPLHQ
jgi:hypothetical protein